MREKINTFVHCKNMLEVMTKTALKGKEVDVLYCIVDTDVYVFQGFKTIKIDLEQFANGLDIDLAEAQVIIHRKPETLLEAKQMITESLAQLEDVKDVVKEEIKEKISEEAAEVKETIEQLVGDVVESIDYKTIYFELKDKMIAIEKKLNHYIEKYGELIEEEKIEEVVVKEEVEE